MTNCVEHPQDPTHCDIRIWVVACDESLAEVCSLELITKKENFRY